MESFLLIFKKKKKWKQCTDPSPRAVSVHSLSFPALLWPLELTSTLGSLPVAFCWACPVGNKAGEITTWRRNEVGALFVCTPAPSPALPPHCLAGSGYLAIPLQRSKLSLVPVVPESLIISYWCPWSCPTPLTSPFTKPFSVNPINVPSVSCQDPNCLLRRVIKSL